MIEKVILDTDMGSDVDDACALVYGLKSSDMKISAVTTVYGDVDTRSKVSKALINKSNSKNTQVYSGKSRPLKTVYRFMFETGREGEGILTDKEFSSNIDQLGIHPNAVQYLIDITKQYPGEYNIVSIGALTNIAEAQLRDPNFLSRIKHHYIMGGGLSFPREFDPDFYFPTDSPEHNIACDITAAKIVLEHDYPKTLVPIDITARTPIKRNNFERLSRLGPMERSLKSLVDIWFDYRDKAFGRRVDYTCMHDPLTLALVTRPDLVETTRLPISVDNNGLTLIGDGKDNTNVVTDLDEKAFERLFLDTILS